MDQDELVNKRVARIARDQGSSVAEVNAALDRHPIELDRDKYLRRTLALELHKLDELEEAFHSKAILNRDVAAGALLVKIYERRATLLGLNPPTGHAVAIIQNPPADQPNSFDRIRAAVDQLMHDDKSGEPAKPDDDDKLN